MFVPRIRGVAPRGFTPSRQGPAVVWIDGGGEELRVISPSLGACTTMRRLAVVVATTLLLCSMWVGLGVRASAGAPHAVSSMGRGMGQKDDDETAGGRARSCPTLHALVTQGHKVVRYNT